MGWPAAARVAADRYAAALCLFELFVGAHAFDGNVPAGEPAWWFGRPM